MALNQVHTAAAAQFNMEVSAPATVALVVAPMVLVVHLPPLREALRIYKRCIEYPTCISTRGLPAQVAQGTHTTHQAHRFKTPCG